MTGGGQNWPVQVVVPDTVTCPDIAVLLAAVSVNTDVVVTRIVVPSRVDVNTKVHVMFTALPEIEPLMELSAMVRPPPGGGTWAVPEIEEPV